MNVSVVKDLAFPSEEYRERLISLRRRMHERKLDALLVSTPENICYLTGFSTAGYYFPQVVVVTHDSDPLIVVRSLESKSVEAFSWLDMDRCRVFQDNQEPMEVVARALAELNVSAASVGVDFRSWFFTIEAFRKLEALLPRVALSNGFGLVEKNRSVKSSREIEYIRRACAISGRGIEIAVNYCGSRLTTEAELAAEIHREVVALGSEYPGLPLFLSSGHRTLVPHATWTAKPIVRGDNVFIELTGVVRRYAGPLFRTLFIGQPDPRFKERAAVVEEMLESVLEAIRPGTTSGDVNDAAVRKAGKIGVTKRAGYSVGLNYPPDWGEGFFLDLKASDPTVLEPGMVFHIPQTFRVPGELPVAISETVLVTDDGREILTDFPRHLIVID